MGKTEPSWGKVAAATALLCLLAYLPFFRLPLISDDYLQIGLARLYGSWEGQQTLFADALYRCRATALWVTWALDRLFGPVATPSAVFCLVVHFLNCLMVFALVREAKLGGWVAAASACFFAVYEGHQEAVVWISAMPELLVFLFGCLAVLGGLRWIGGAHAGWLAVAVAAYGLALLSKESAVVVGLVLGAYGLAGRLNWRRWLPLAAGMGVVAAFYTHAIFVAKQSHLHFNDGTFSLSAPFLATLLISTGRLFWFWGMLALVAGLATRTQQFGRVLGTAGIWIVLTFLPYVFLTYMPRVPSRHTYWASAGLALVVGAAFMKALPRLSDKRGLVVAVGAVIVLHNCLYLWTKKLGQYQERARSTEELLAYSRRTPGTVRVRCFPYGSDIVFYSLEIVEGRRREEIEVNPEAAGEAFCFEPGAE
ncbi:MAG: hypothetical protein IT163_01310 [Bryobacterales bacterium]|nr:hypothetical protein [Bryobacterales bacterium]